MPVPLTTGTWPKDQETQCVIDEETSFALFGDCNGTGNTIWFEDKHYEVTGIADSHPTPCYSAFVSNKLSFLSARDVYTKEVVPLRIL